MMSTQIQAITKASAKEFLFLKVGEEQEGFIDSVEECLEEARKEKRLIPLGLYQDGAAVGFAMYGIFRGQVWLDHYLIDKRYQGNGLGRRFLEKILQFFKKEHPGRDIYLSVAKDNEKAIHLYKSYGFSFTGKVMYGHERVMRRGNEEQSPASPSERMSVC